MDGYVKISNGINSAEVQTGNGHQLSPSHVSINNNEIEAKAKIYDGKTYVQFSFIDELMKLSDSKNYSQVSTNDISPARSFENIGPLRMPV